MKALVQVAFLAALLVLAPGRVRSQCLCDPCGGGLALGPSCPDCNVIWQPDDKIAGCPAGDSLILSSPQPHPSRMRITVHYEDANCVPRVGVPPESIWVTYQILSTPPPANLRVNDKGARVYADDSTDANGNTRITLPSFSGCGRVRLRLFVSGVSNYGTRDREVRTTDFDSNGRTNESVANCDLNYDGAKNGLDLSIASAHNDHWHRNALHATLVRRTNYGQGVPGILGAGQVFWSPSGRYLSHDRHPPGACKVFVVPSDPRDGDALTQLTFPTIPDSADYDPSWSPLNTEFTFGRFDNTIYRQGLPWTGDTQIHLVTHHDDGSADHRGDLNGAISPDGQWVAFTRRTFPNQPYEIFKIPITGDTTQRVKLTALTDASDFYPQWSPDGEWIIFQRQFLAPNFWNLYKVRADGSSNLEAVPVFTDSLGKISDHDASNPGFSPDGAIVLAEYGPRVAGEQITHTLDPALEIKKPIANYDEPQFSANTNAGIDFPILSPRLSPDGTRLALTSTQVWAARRNMSSPPVFTDVGGPVVDTVAVVTKSVSCGSLLQFTVTATDPEGDPPTYQAFFLQPGMSFDEGTRTSSWTPSGGACGKTHFVKFRVTTITWPKASGGADAVICKIVVGSGLGLAAEAADPIGAAAASEAAQGPNPTREGFVLGTPRTPGLAARLLVFDLSGRLVSVVRGPSGTPLVWDGRDRHGARVANGVYLYRLEIGRQRRDGKIVVVR